MSLILSTISIIVSALTLLIYLFQEYKDLFTIYWFAEYDVVYIPIVCENTLRPMDFIEKYQKEFHRNLGICEFKKQWVGNLNTIYYYQTLNKDDVENLYLKPIFISIHEHKYFVRIVVTHKGRKSIKLLQKIKGCLV